jgi:putative phosphoribosyl transferase
MPFRDRVDAGRRLAAALLPLRAEHPVVLGLPRGGVPVAAEVARALGAPLDVVLVRKLGLPRRHELAMGAIGEQGVRVLNGAVLRTSDVSAEDLTRVEQAERAELDRRSRRIRAHWPRVPLTGRTVILVDDGIATGSTARAACQVARALGAARVVLAAPVGAPDSVEALRQVADEVVCPETPRAFAAVGQWYDDFRPTTDEDVERLLSQSATAAPRPAVDRDVDVGAGPVRLAGHLTVPPDARGLVVFAHGSGSSRHSPRNRAVASVLNGAGLGTLLFDLLSTDEEQDTAKVFDIGLLGQRLAATTAWLRTLPEAQPLPIGYFGASTGAGAALWAAAEAGSDVAAVVSRGGRPDLAGDRLRDVRAPTLLVVGSLDELVLELNREAAAQLTCEHQVAVVPGATHLFVEPGTLLAAAELARDWFVRHLAPQPSAPARHAPGGASWP